jgi:hypothetical protein
MARRLVDRERIIAWANARGAAPARVADTPHDESDPGLRLDFFGTGASEGGDGADAERGEEKIVPISWDEWFRTFEKYRLALVVDELEASAAVN